MQSHLRSIDDVTSLLLSGHVDALEIHTSAGYEAQEIVQGTLNDEHAVEERVREGRWGGGGGGGGKGLCERVCAGVYRNVSVGEGHQMARWEGQG